MSRADMAEYSDPTCAAGALRRLLGSICTQKRGVQAQGMPTWKRHLARKAVRLAAGRKLVRDSIAGGSPSFSALEDSAVEKRAWQKKRVKREI